MRKILSLMLSLMLLLSVMAPAVFAESALSDDIVILYTNDVHTYIDGTLSYDVIAGVKAGNHDITHIFGDATLRIGTRNYDELVAFLERISKIEDVEFIFTVSADKEELPKKLFDIAEII